MDGGLRSPPRLLLIPLPTPGRTEIPREIVLKYTQKVRMTLRQEHHRFAFRLNFSLIVSSFRACSPGWNWASLRVQPLAGVILRRSCLCYTLDKTRRSLQLQIRAKKKKNCNLPLCFPQAWRTRSGSLALSLTHSFRVRSCLKLSGWPCGTKQGTTITGQCHL